MPTITIDGVRLSYLDNRREAPAALLVHGFPLNAGMWSNQVDALGDRFRVLAPDLRGFGQSDAPDDPAAYSIEGYADDLEAVLDDAEVNRATLVGLSMGGYISFAFWRKHPERLQALVLANTRAEADDDAGRARRAAQQKVVAEQGTGPVIEGLIDSVLGKTTLAKKPDVVERVRALMDNPSAGFVGALEALKKRPDSTSDLDAIDVPALIVSGEEDEIIPAQAARAMQDRIADARLVTIPEAGHLSNLEAPIFFNGAVAEFLAGL